MKKCLICDKKARQVSEDRPCCPKCEKTAPMAIQAPALFTDGIVGEVATLVRKTLRTLNSAIEAQLAR